MTSGPTDIGSASEEAAKLLAALRGWLDDHLATGDAQCQVCPLCQLIMALRESRPEVAHHLMAAGLSLASAVRAFLDGADASGAAGPDGDADSAAVVPIDIAGDEG